MQSKYNMVKADQESKDEISGKSRSGSFIIVICYIHKVFHCVYSIPTLQLCKLYSIGGKYS
jgi:hypothetical protein